MKPRAPKSPAARTRRRGKAPAGADRPDSPDPLPDFDPVPVAARRDGWTPQKQTDFLVALAESACVADACRTVGMAVGSAYRLRVRPDAVSFRRAWDMALDVGVQRLADAAYSRAINGVATPIFFQGEQVGERRRYDERLTMFLLRTRDRARYGHGDDRKAGRHPEAMMQMFLLAARRAIEDARLPADAEDIVQARFDQRLREVIEEEMQGVVDGPPDGDGDGGGE